MKNILYIAYYNDDNYHDCLGVSCQIDKAHDSVLHIFDDQNIASIYKQKCLSNNDHIKLVNDNNKKLLAIVSEYKNSYKAFCFLKTTKVIFNKFNIKDLSSPCNIFDIGYLLSLNQIIDLDRKGISYYDVFLNTIDQYCENNNSLTSYFVNTKINTTKKHNKIPDEKPVINSDAIFYNDNNCLFAIFNSKQHLGLIRSPAYLNKNNNKIYSVKNNCLGTVMGYSLDHVEIEWLINENKIISKYIRDADNIYN